MPFTPSHAAAVLPLLRTPLPASALVIGSLTPDLPFYLPGGFPWRTHTALAVVTTDVVLGLVAWVVWHGLLAEPALAAAPAGLRGRIPGPPPGLRTRLASPARAGWTVTALAVGAATHVLWDEFTHARRWGPAHIQVLAEDWGSAPGYRWLQYASSVLGGVVLLLWLVRWWRRTPPRPGVRRPGVRWAWAVLLAVGGSIGAVAAAGAPDLGAAVYEGATSGGQAGLGVAALLAVAWHVRHRSR
ncbi:DUF4184 family protein [Blastococcus sp. SYSU D00922]